LQELVNTNSMILNIFAVNKMPNLGTYFLILSNAMFLTLIIVCPATAQTHQSSRFVWTQWQNETGWTSKYIVAATGLVNPGE
jgi:choline transport protein